MYKVIKSAQIDMRDQVVIPKSSNDYSVVYDDDDDNVSFENSTLAEAVEYKIRLEKEASNLLYQAKIEAEVMLDDAKRKSQLILEQANMKAADLKNQGREDGYKEGYKNAYELSMEKYSALVNESIRLLDEAEKYKENTLRNLESEIIQLVLSSVEKITKKILQEDDDIVIEIIKSSIENMTFRDHLILRISSDDYESVNNTKDRLLSMYPGIKAIDIKIVEDFNKGDIDIENESGSVNPSVSYQIKKLFGEFNKLMSGDEEL